MRAAAFVLLAGALTCGCSRPAPQPIQTDPAVAARLSANEARIASLEGRVNSLEAAKPAEVAAPQTARTFMLVETSKVPNEPAVVTRTQFPDLAECRDARQKALADAASDAQAASKTQVEQLPSGATHIIPARTPPKVSAVCLG